MKNEAQNAEERETDQENLCAEGKSRRREGGGEQESWTGEKGVSLSHWPGFSEVTLQTD